MTDKRITSETVEQSDGEHVGCNDIVLPRLRSISLRIAERILSEWDRIEMEAGQEGQLHQDYDAETAYQTHELDDLIESELRSLVCDCADVCDRRAAMRDGRSTMITNEASKCGAAVRHSMLAVTGTSSVCLHCFGRGCERCDRGEVKYVR